MEDFFKDIKDFDNHRVISYFHDSEVGLEGFIALHRGSDKTPAFGATRFVQYANKNEALRDVVRLSKLMSYKSAMAGLKYGGAKAVIISPKKLVNKNKLLKAYAHKINYFHGLFITGADVGISAQEVKEMKKNSPYVVGVKTDPVKFTALGINFALDVCLKNVFGTTELENRTFAIQGVGKIGSALLKSIYGKAKNIYITDTDKLTLKKIAKTFPKVKITKVDEIFHQKVDVLSPCAMAHALNSKRIPRIKAQIILGGANNQLTHPGIGELLHKLGILYAPDYVVNGGGLICVVSEYENPKISDQEIYKKVEVIKSTMHTIIKQSQLKNKATNLIADEIAQKIFNK
jgi:leucine dehydrogenase